MESQVRQERDPRSTEQFIVAAAALLRDNGVERLKQFDHFPAPLYATDESGTVTYFNAACVEFAGRTPNIGSDQWCVTWKLECEDGTPLPHDQCPMAVAVREGRPVRGLAAVAERPDGQRLHFRPFPTPAIDAAGQIAGAVNLLVPSDGRARDELLANSSRYRRLASWVSDAAVSDTLNHMALECEDQAATLRPD
jgi:PAS domain-containing protein